MISILLSGNQTVWSIQNLLFQIGIPLEWFNGYKFFGATRNSVKRFKINKKSICNNLKYCNIDPLNFVIILMKNKITCNSSVDNIMRKNYMFLNIISNTSFWKLNLLQSILYGILQYSSDNTSTKNVSVKFSE